MEKQWITIVIANDFLEVWLVDNFDRSVELDVVAVPLQGRQQTLVVDVVEALVLPVLDVACLPVAGMHLHRQFEIPPAPWASAAKLLTPSKSLSRRLIWATDTDAAVGQAVKTTLMTAPLESGSS